MVENERASIGNFFKDFTFKNYYYDYKNSDFIKTIKDALIDYNKKTPLIIKGNSGTGKTHLLGAIYNEFLEQNKNLHINYTHAETFRQEYSEAITNRKLIDFKQKYRNSDILLIDNFEFFTNKEEIQKEMFYTLVAMQEKRGFVGIAITSPCNLEKFFDSSLINILNQGISVDVPKPGRVAKHLFIYSILIENKCFLPEETINYLANSKYNICELKGKLDRLIFVKNLKRNGSIDISKEEIIKLFQE